MNLEFFFLKNLKGNKTLFFSKNKTGEIAFNSQTFQ
jgi:hypothetical protein